MKHVDSEPFEPPQMTHLQLGPIQAPEFGKFCRFPYSIRKGVPHQGRLEPE